eukprot:1882617-Rhodomonas_salina.1
MGRLSLGTSRLCSYTAATQRPVQIWDIPLPGCLSYMVLHFKSRASRIVVDGSPERDYPSAPRPSLSPLPFLVSLSRPL